MSAGGGTPPGETRLRVSVTGVVQGVGFRPFLYRLANELGVGGWVRNTPSGVILEVQGESSLIGEFLRRMEQEAPPGAGIYHCERKQIPLDRTTEFAIEESSLKGARTATLLPDLATCVECIHEIFDPADRRFRYPFTNCTHCGPRFSILRRFPYDRPNTTMSGFEMCERCRAEYERPDDRRYHAQPIACPTCGPHLELWSAAGAVLASHDQALLLAVEAIFAGGIVAVKGLGGFQLLVDARNELAVQKLRQRKHRKEKPFAVMAPSWNWIRAHCDPNEVEANLVRSPQAPIVLLREKRRSCTLAPAVNPELGTIGVMLPYTPLHHLLLAELDSPVVATSGNRAEEPLCTDEREALERLQRIADLFLIHNRPIERPLDDSVARVVADRPLLLRRARGYAPLPIRLDDALPPVLATGSHLKNTAALSSGNLVFLSQHLGDLETSLASQAYVRGLADLRTLQGITPAIVACDAHTDYRSTHTAEALARAEELPLVRVQHHLAHILACMAENGLKGPVLGVCWDGAGYGDDGTTWGGEFLLANAESHRRVAHLRPFRLPGGDQAAREPRRSALGVMFEIDSRNGWSINHTVAAFSYKELQPLRQMLKADVASPWTTSAGRLFDAAASFLGLQQRSTFEGQAAMRLEQAAEASITSEEYPLRLFQCDDGAPFQLDWEPTIRALLEDSAEGRPPDVIARRFHNTMAEGIAAVARQMNVADVVLTGGCFQNRVLSEEAILRLRNSGFRPHWHRLVPPNDGGIALGQVIAAARMFARGETACASRSRAG